jgi:cytochrome oxidase Cu insertion factor (SCO1/SenC/PrrC family)
MNRMSAFIRRARRAAGFGSVAALVAVAAVPAVAAGSSNPTQPAGSVGTAVSIPLTSAVASARFVNQFGRAESLGALKGKTVFVVPFLALCHDTCPFTAGDLLQLQALLNKAGASNVAVVAIDVDPYRDTQKRLAAYSKMIGAGFQFWRETGKTTTPRLNKTSPIGTGDTNPNLTVMEKFFGWTVQVVPSTPEPRDWMAPHERLTYDINHSDGFWVINSDQTVRFVSGDKPHFRGTIAKTLSLFMGNKSDVYKDVNPHGWSPKGALQAISWVAGTQY